MSEIKAIDSIPEKWSQETRCLICNGVFLQIKRSQHQPDKMYCPNCNVDFTIAEDGKHVFFVKIPSIFPKEIRGEWVTKDDISQALKAMAKPERNAATNIPTANPLRAEAVRKARGLVELGNSKEEVRNALAASLNLTQFAIDEVVTDAFNVFQIQQRKKSKNIMLFAGITIGGLIMLIILLTMLF